MSATTIGLIAGLILGLAGALGGFGAFIVTLFLGAVGVAAGRLVDVRGDISAFLSSRDRERL